MRKREILPLISRCQIALANMSEDAAKLEVMDNDQASRRLKRDIRAFKDGPLKDFTEKVFEIREQIKNKK